MIQLFPRNSIIFSPLIANPREPIYSIAYRFNDTPLSYHQMVISAGDILPILLIQEIADMDWSFQIELSGAIWGNFDISTEARQNGEWAEYITSDYLISIPITFSIEIGHSGYADIIYLVT